MFDSIELCSDVWMRNQNVVGNLIALEFWSQRTEQEAMPSVQGDECTHRRLDSYLSSSGPTASRLAGVQRPWSPVSLQSLTDTSSSAYFRLFSVYVDEAISMATTKGEDDQPRPPDRVALFGLVILHGTK